MARISILTVLFSLLYVISPHSYAQTINGYTLQPGDELQISVWREDTLDKEVIVLPDGSITFPLIGTVSVNDLSSVELENLLEEKLVDHVPNAEVTVIINSVRGNSVFVIGKVVRPGEYIMSSEMTIPQVLSLAGGLAQFADDNSIKVLRKENEQARYYEFDYGDLVSGKVLDSIIFVLEAGDVVIVP